VAETKPQRRITFLFDVDNTLIDNDRAKEGLSRRIGEVLGPEGERRFWELYEEIRRETGLVNIPLILGRYAEELTNDPALSEAERRQLRFDLADAVMNFPYRDYLYPGAIEAVRQARQYGTVAVLSEGDATFQPHKIWTSGLDPEVDGNVLVFDHKLEHLDEMIGAYPADHYVLVEDKPEILAAIKRALGSRITTVLVRQGKYANRPLDEQPAPDRVFDNIGAFAASDFSELNLDAVAEVGSES
jgi:FMN phosphatase YigB (HAD superfamily)